MATVIPARQGDEFNTILGLLNYVQRGQQFKESQQLAKDLQLLHAGSVEGLMPVADVPGFRDAYARISGLKPEEIPEGLQLSPESWDHFISRVSTEYAKKGQVNVPGLLQDEAKNLVRTYIGKQTTGQPLPIEDIPQYQATIRGQLQTQQAVSKIQLDALKLLNDPELAPTFSNLKLVGTSLEEVLIGATLGFNPMLELGARLRVSTAEVESDWQKKWNSAVVDAAQKMGVDPTLVANAWISLRNASGDPEAYAAAYNAIPNDIKAGLVLVQKAAESAMIEQIVKGAMAGNLNATMAMQVLDLIKSPWAKDIATDKSTQRVWNSMVSVLGESLASVYSGLGDVVKDYLTPSVLNSLWFDTEQTTGGFLGIGSHFTPGYLSMQGEYDLRQALMRQQAQAPARTAMEALFGNTPLNQLFPEAWAAMGEAEAQAGGTPPTEAPPAQATPYGQTVAREEELTRALIDLGTEWNRLNYARLSGDTAATAQLVELEKRRDALRRELEEVTRKRAEEWQRLRRTNVEAYVPMAPRGRMEER